MLVSLSLSVRRCSVSALLLSGSVTGRWRDCSGQESRHRPRSQTQSECKWGEGEQWFVCSVLNVSSDLASLHRLSWFFSFVFTAWDVQDGSRLAKERCQLKPQNGNEIPPPEILIGFVFIYLFIIFYKGLFAHLKFQSVDTFWDGSKARSLKLQMRLNLSDCEAFLVCLSLLFVFPQNAGHDS